MRNKKPINSIRFTRWCIDRVCRCCIPAYGCCIRFIYRCLSLALPCCKPVICAGSTVQNLVHPCLLPIRSQQPLACLLKSPVRQCICLIRLYTSPIQLVERVIRLCLRLSQQTLPLAVLCAGVIPELKSLGHQGLFLVRLYVLPIHQCKHLIRSPFPSVRLCKLPICRVKWSAQACKQPVHLVKTIVGFCKFHFIVILTKSRCHETTKNIQILMVQEHLHFNPLMLPAGEDGCAAGSLLREYARAAAMTGPLGK